MRLTWKVSLAIAGAICGVFLLNAAFRVRREVRRFEERMRHDHQLLGRAVAGAAALVSRTEGPSKAARVIEDANRGESEIVIRWVRLVAPADDQATPIVQPAFLQAVRSGKPQTVRLDRTEPGLLVTYVPSSIPGELDGALELRESLADESAYSRKTIVDALVLSGGMIAVSTLLAVILGTILVARPMRNLVKQANLIGKGDLASRLVLPQRDEIGVLATAMNQMADQLAEAHACTAQETAARITALEQLRHADRLMTVGKLAAGIAHEVGTPLNVITGHAQLILDDYPPDSSAAQNATIVNEQVERVGAIVRQLLDFARRGHARRFQQDIRPVVHQTVHLLEALARKRDVALDLTESVDELSCLADLTLLQQAITNLIINAVQAMPGPGNVGVAVGRRHAAQPDELGGQEGDYAFIEVTDQGAGISAADLPRIFEPFFTTKGVGVGTGLGLSVTHGIALEHEGWIAVHSEVGKGSRFSIYLPLARSS